MVSGYYPLCGEPQDLTPWGFSLSGDTPVSTFCFPLSVQRRTVKTMSTVFLGTTKRVFHKTEDCYLIWSPSEVTPVGIDEIGKARPCYRCYPDVPRAVVVRRFCPQCNKSRTKPCEHNGGVRVPVEVKVGRRTLVSEPDDTFIRWTWVWPERAHRYLRDQPVV